MSGTVLVDPTQISNIQHNPTPDMRYVTILPQVNYADQGQPTSMRAIRARYDPYEQTRGRVDQLRSLGHSVDKVEIMYVNPSS